MSKSSSRSIGIGSIIFWIFIGYIIFGGDSDNDKKEVEIKANDNKIIEDMKKSASRVKKEAQKIINEVKKEIAEIKVEEEIPIIEEEDIKKETEPEEKEAELKSLEEISDNQKLKKL